MTTPPLRAVIYARFSTDMQSDNSIEDQIRLCRDYAARQGLQVVEVYSDRAMSGASLMRSGVQKLLRDGRSEIFDVVVSEALNRLSRNQADIAQIYQTPPGPGDHAAWATTLASRPDLAPAVGFDDCIAWACRVAQGLESPGAAAAEPAVRRLVDGLAHRSRALRLLGNGVHPLAAAHAWRALAAAHGLGPVDLATGGWTGGPSADEPL